MTRFRMPAESIEVRPSKKPRQVLDAGGQTLEIPESWELLMPDDAAVSRRIKKDGPA